MRLLHLNTNYIGNALYAHLYRALAAAGASHQDVFVPVRKADHLGRHDIDVPGVAIRYAHVLRPWHRLLFGAKIRTTLAALDRLVAPQQLPASTVVHAHTLYSDGAVALELHRRHGLPYVVTVRNTDVHVFHRFFPHLHPTARAVATSASALIFLSPAYRDRHLARLFGRAAPSLADRSRVVPNGIDPAWFSDESPLERDRDGVRMLYVGAFTRNKNLGGIVAALDALRHRGIEARLRLVGHQPSARIAAGLARRAARDPGLELYPHTASLSELKDHYDWATVFVMPSFRESFGLVYAEALSRGIPVVYTRGEGFDGWLASPTCGRGVDPRDPDDIANAVTEVASHWQPNACRTAARTFRWPAIAKQLVGFYQSVLSG